jgi:prepilin-type processing-associated H-X9-DG protein
MAMSQYLTDYDQTLPGGRASNSQDDPGPPRDSPDPWGLDIYAIVGDQLDKYLRHDLRIWHCPAARVVTMDIDTVHASLIEEDGGHPGDATTGDVFGPAGRWRPGYFYMSMRSWEFNNTPTWRGLGMWRDDWMARNIGGLKVNELNTLGAQAPSEIVLFVDYSSKFHSYKAADELDDVPQTAKQLDGASPAVINREKFQSNFLYLDGHVETKRYDWVGGLLNVLHRPIKQSWGGKDWFYEHKPGYRHHYPD